MKKEHIALGEAIAELEWWHEKGKSGQLTFNYVRGKITFYRPNEVIKAGEEEHSSRRARGSPDAVERSKR